MQPKDRSALTSRPPGPARTFSHITPTGDAKMVNVGAKADQSRRAKAEGFIICAPATIDLLNERALPKGDVLTVARIAAIQATKQTSSLIPLCHNLRITGADISFEVLPDRVRIEATVESSGKTGVEMEALIAVSVAALTIYDMCKAVDKGMVVEGVRLVEKTKQ